MRGRGPVEIQPWKGGPCLGFPRQFLEGLESDVARFNVSAVKLIPPNRSWTDCPCAVALKMTRSAKERSLTRLYSAER
jgi:hypothetical protein